MTNKDYEHFVNVNDQQHSVRVFRHPFLSRALEILSVLLFQFSKSGGKIKNAYYCNNHLICHLPEPPKRQAGVVERVACCCLEEDTVVAVVASLLALHHSELCHCISENACPSIIATVFFHKLILHKPHHAITNTTTATFNEPESFHIE